MVKFIRQRESYVVKRKIRMRVMVLPVFFVGVSLVLLACRQPSGGGPPPPPAVVVNSVVISPHDISVVRGGGQQFTVTVNGSDGVSQEVTWSLVEAHHADTTLVPNATGALLTVAANETAGTLTVKAESQVDTAKSDQATVTLRDPGDTFVSTVTIDPPSVSIHKGEVRQFTATVTGSAAVSQAVTWSLVGDHHADTTLGLNATGALLTVAADEPPGTFSVRATSTVDTDKYGEAGVTVLPGESSTTALSPPASVTLSNIGGASWPAVEHAVSYTAQLYKGETPVAGAVYTGTDTSKDFLSAMQSGGEGSYTVKVMAVGDGTAYSNSSETVSGSQTVWTRDPVQYVWWFETTKARWVNVDGDSNYTVQLYNGESKAGGPVSVDRENVSNPGGGPGETMTTYDLTAAMSGSGSYTFGVVTKGNGYLILDAVEKKIEDPYVNGTNQLSTPANLKWSGNTAQWDAVPNATGYSVQLFKNGAPEGTAVTASGTSHNFSANVTGSGVYTFTVTAKGDGGVTSSDSAAADSAGTVGGGGSLTVGSTASITFTATDESGNLTVGGAVSEISKTTGTTSLALTVSGTDFTGFTWIVDGRSITTSGNGITLGEGGTTLTINATDPAVRLGGHSVTVSAKKGGVPWSPKQAVSFTVKR